jgi:hypothetical protein
MKKLNLDYLKVQSFVTEVKHLGGLAAIAGESDFNTVCDTCTGCIGEDKFA